MQIERFFFVVFCVLVLVAFVFAVALAYRRGVSRTRAKLLPEMERMLRTMERAGLRETGRLPLRLSDDDPTGSWTGMPTREEDTRPPGVSRRWDEVRPRG